jgi:hypothetical protein
MTEQVDLATLPIDELLEVASEEAGRVLNRQVLLNPNLSDKRAREIFSMELLKVVAAWMREQPMGGLCSPGYSLAIDNLEDIINY